MRKIKTAIGNSIPVFLMFAIFYAILRGYLNLDSITPSQTFAASAALVSILTFTANYLDRLSNSEEDYYLGFPVKTFVFRNSFWVRKFLYTPYLKTMMWVIILIPTGEWIIEHLRKNTGASKTIYELSARELFAFQGDSVTVGIVIRSIWGAAFGILLLLSVGIFISTINNAMGQFSIADSVSRNISDYGNRLYVEIKIGERYIRNFQCAFRKIILYSSSERFSRILENFLYALKRLEGKEYNKYISIAVGAFSIVLGDYIRHTVSLIKITDTIFKWKVRVRLVEKLLIWWIKYRCNKLQDSMTRWYSKYALQNLDESAGLAILVETAVPDIEEISLLESTLRNASAQEITRMYCHHYVMWSVFCSYCYC